MGRCWLVCGVVGLVLVGCNSNSQPRGKRASPEITTKGKFNHGAGTHGADGDPHRKLDEKFDDAGGEVRLDSLTLTAPKGWPRKTPMSTIIQAEYVLPRAEGDSRDGRLTLSVVGGNLEDNIARWKDQFGGSPEKSQRDKMDVNGLSVTLVDFSGDFNDQPAPFAPAVKRSGYRMIAAIIPLGDQLHFVKAVGPARTMETHAKKIKTFVQSAKK